MEDDGFTLVKSKKKSVQRKRKPVPQRKNNFEEKTEEFFDIEQTLQ